MCEEKNDVAYIEQQAYKEDPESRPYAGKHSCRDLACTTAGDDAKEERNDTEERKIGKHQTSSYLAFIQVR